MQSSCHTCNFQFIQSVCNIFCPCHSKKQAFSTSFDKMQHNVFCKHGAMASEAKLFCNFCLAVAPPSNKFCCVFMDSFDIFRQKTTKQDKNGQKLRIGQGKALAKQKVFAIFRHDLTIFTKLRQKQDNSARLLFGEDADFVILLRAVVALADIRRRWMVARVQKAFSTFFDKNRHEATKNKVLPVPQNTFFDTIRQHSPKPGKVPQKQTKFVKLMQKSTNFCHIAQMLPF